MNNKEYDFCEMSIKCINVLEDLYKRRYSIFIKTKNKDILYHAYDMNNSFVKCISIRCFGTYSIRYDDIEEIYTNQLFSEYTEHTTENSISIRFKKVWEREYIEMTVQEISEKLGYDVKIIK